MVVTPHPLNNQPEEMIRSLAHEYIDKIVAGLTTGR